MLIRISTPSLGGQVLHAPKVVAIVCRLDQDMHVEFTPGVTEDYDNHMANQSMYNFKSGSLRGYLGQRTRYGVTREKFVDVTACI